jgi:hypothetical protein
MHALVVHGTIHNADRTREVLNSQVLPLVSGAPGFKAGYWTWPNGEEELNVLAMIIFDSEENALAAADRVSANFSQLENRDDVTLDGVEVREVVAFGLITRAYSQARRAPFDARRSPTPISVES